MGRVRTNIEIEDTYVRAIMDRYGVRTKAEAVELALRHLAGQPTSREEALAMRGTRAVVEAPADAPPEGFGCGDLSMPKGEGRRLLGDLLTKDEHGAFVNGLADDPDLATT